MTTSLQLVSELDKAAFLYASQPAVSDGIRYMTYSELGRNANALAAGILAARDGMEGAEGPLNIGFLLSPSPETVCSIYGILKSGNVYVPLDVYLTDRRLGEIVEDAVIRILLTDSTWMHKAAALTEGRNIVLLNVDGIEGVDTFPSPEEIGPARPAYIMYTSGSTGKPKGVVQTHENILHFSLEFARLLRITDQDRIALTTSFSHAVSVIDLFSHLLKGALIFIYDVRKEKNLLVLSDYIIAHRITVFHSIPNLFRLLFGPQTPDKQESSVRLVILGGEDIRNRDFELFQKALPPRAVLVNLYGSSELILATAELMNKHSPVPRQRIPIGRPVTGVTFTVMEDGKTAAGVLRVGELVLRSRYISPGYWRMPGKDTLASDPADAGFRIYRSGDLVRMLPSGVLEFMGRNDSQIKINGHRIELQEIELTADAFPGVKKSIVRAFVRENDQPCIACFYTAGSPEGMTGPDAGELRAHILRSLPDYMLPEIMLELPEFPLTATGKIDREKLTMQLCLDRKKESAAGPSTPAQISVAAIWADILGHDSFSITDRFFDVGGNSLKLIELYTKLDGAYPGMLTVQTVFDRQTIIDIASLLEQEHRDELEMDDVMVRDIEF